MACALRTRWLVHCRCGQTFMMGDALAELLADITEAARTIGTLLQTATG